jgi:hypothetical protein
MPAMVNAPRRRQALCLLLALAAACSGGPGDDTHGSQPPPPLTADPADKAVPAATEASAAAPDDAAKQEAEPAAPTFGPAKLTALDDRQREILLTGAEDPPIAVDIHYIQSNESRHDLFFPYIENVGGAFIGVASDPGYTLMAKARSELAFMMDIDYRVVDLHHMYRVFILESETPEALHDKWNPDKREESMKLLQEKLADDFDGKRIARILQGYRAGRETVWRHLKKVIARQRDGQPTTWLSDPENYAHVRALYQTGRLRIMHGDLTGGTTLQTVAVACKELGVNVRVLYMSNAEEYFDYTKKFRENMRAQPVDDATMVLRTIYSKKWEHADLWAYQIQPMSDFLARLKQGAKAASRNPMLHYAEWGKQLERDTGIKGFSRLGYGDNDLSKKAPAEE